MVIALPVVLAAASLFPGASLEICLNPAMIEFYRRFLPDAILTPWMPAWFPKRESNVARHWKPRTKRSSYDLVVDLRGELQSGLAACRIGARWRLGLDEFGSSLFYDWAAPFGDGESQQKQLLQPFRLFDADLEAQYPELPEISDDGSRPVIAFATGAGCPSKRWPIAKFAELHHLLKEDAPGYKTRIVGASEDSLWTGAAPDQDWRGRSKASEAFSDLSGAKLLICNDSFYGHLAALFGIPVIVLFSAANDLERWRARGPKAESVQILSTRPECQGCRQRVCDHLRCLEDIGVQDVLRAARRLLVLNGPESESIK
ncbi:MAG: glycosyltransferase family 9 protein [Planctomycetota bacterium]|nr:glycosyltransferase family 9 protein [Planctomycetota bacterium]